MITYSVRLAFSSNEDRNRVIKTLEGQRIAFNEASKIRFRMIKNSIVELHNSFYLAFRQANSWIPADIVISGINDCLAMYASMKSSKHKITKPPVKRGLSMHFNKNLYKFIKEDKAEVKITSVEGKRVIAKLVLYPRVEKMIKNYEMAHPNLYVKDGDIYLGLVFKTPEWKPSVDSPKVVGIDLGLKRVAAASDGKIFKDYKYLNSKRKLRFQKRKLQMIAATKHSKSAKRKLKRLRRKEANQTKNFVHHLTKTLLQTTANVLVLEDLTKIKERKGKKKYQNLNKLSQAPFYMIRKFLTYKAPLYGKSVEVVCPSYTSQIDSRTGKKDGKRQGCRYYGKDGVVLDADVNAAINIARRSKHPNSQIASCNPLDGQAAVIRPIVGRPLGLQVPDFIQG